MNKIKERRQRRSRRKMKSHARSVICMIAIILVLGGVFSVKGIQLRAKEKAYDAQIVELNEQIAEEQQKSEEIDELEKYVGTDEYVEEQAREKLGLVHKNEIIFKAN